MTKSIPIFLIISFCSLSLFAQKNYFQQHVSYDIEVKLDDKNHILRGYEKINYTNNSPDTLRYLFFHLWPNAYKNDKTAFTEHLVENGKTDFYLSPIDQKGFIDSLQFTVNDENVQVSEYDNHQDVIVIELNKPLLPAQQITINTPFRVVIPEVFSRLGHNEQNYQISQWYPKPAVYDHKGWHPIPYLDQGEFYSEFGSFNVRITLPANYVVAATGVLQNPKELLFKNTRMLANDSSLLVTLQKEIPSSDSQKTLVYTQDQIHDFAWFASKYFMVETDTATLASGHKVEINSYYLPTNHKYYESSTTYTKKTIEQLSQMVGEYPYAHASVVDGKLLAGGGMEYPMVTVIGSVSSKNLLKTVIIHEVGHNWFYGILGSNERNHPWLDEGINSFYENILDKKINLPDDKDTTPNRTRQIGINFSSEKMGNLTYLFTAAIRRDQAVENKAPDFSAINYGGMVYSKAAMMMAYLQQYLGESLFDSIMQTYFSQWKFKHPYPEDFQKIVTSHTQKNLDWFFDQAINSATKIDFKLGKIIRQNQTYQVYAHSKTDFKGPIPIQAYQHDSLIYTAWIEYPYSTPAIFNHADSIHKITVDGQNMLPELKINNNHWSRNGLWHRSKPRIRPGSALGLSSHQDVYLLPALGYNYYDGFMLGTAFHSIQIPNRKFQFALTPLYSFATRHLVGSGSMAYTIYPQHFLQRITFSVSHKSHHFDESSLNISKPLFLRYHASNAAIDVLFKKKYERHTASNGLLLQVRRVQNQAFIYNRDTNNLFYPAIVNRSPLLYASADFTHKNTRTFHPYTLEARAEMTEYFVKLSTTGNLRIDYYPSWLKQKRKSVFIRAFAGKFIDISPANTMPFRSAFFSATHTAGNDFLFRDLYMARSEQQGLLSQQIANREGNMKIRTSQYANPIGLSDNWLASLNFLIDLPASIPIRTQLFADVATFSKAASLNPSGQKLLYDAGIKCSFFANAISIYLPFAMSKDFKDYSQTIYTSNRMLRNMSFSLKLTELPLFHTQEVALDVLKF